MSFAFRRLPKMIKPVCSPESGALVQRLAAKHNHDGYGFEILFLGDNLALVHCSDARKVTPILQRISLNGVGLYQSRMAESNTLPPGMVAMWPDYRVGQPILGPVALPDEQGMAAKTAARTKVLLDEIAYTKYLDRVYPEIQAALREQWFLSRHLDEVVSYCCPDRAYELKVLISRVLPEGPEQVRSLDMDILTEVVDLYRKRVTEKEAKELEKEAKAARRRWLMPQPNTPSIK